MNAGEGKAIFVFGVPPIARPIWLSHASAVIAFGAGLSVAWPSLLGDWLFDPGTLAFPVHEPPAS